MRVIRKAWTVADVEAKRSFVSDNNANGDNGNNGASITALTSQMSFLMCKFNFAWWCVEGKCSGCDKIKFAS